MKNPRAHNCKPESCVGLTAQRMRDDEDSIAQRFQGEGMCSKNSKGKCFWRKGFLGSGTCSYAGAEEGLSTLALTFRPSHFESPSLKFSDFFGLETGLGPPWL